VWGSVLGLALLWALNPALLGLILLVISRPRPVANLLACWVGCLITNVPALVIPLLALHSVPAFRSYVHDSAGRASGAPAQHAQLVMGAIMLSVAAVLAARLWARRRARVPAPVGGGVALADDPDTALARPRDAQGGGRDQGKSAIRRLYDRANNAWESGALWVAVLVGMGFLPGPPLLLIVDTTIASSGAAIGTQVVAAVVFVVGMLAVFEVVLVSYLAAPAKTMAVLRPIHEWSTNHRAHVIAAIFTGVGLFQLVRGLGIA
jgi:Sap, sulfolipid-1-addressing protein